MEQVTTDRRREPNEDVADSPLRFSAQQSYWDWGIALFGPPPARTQFATMTSFPCPHGFPSMHSGIWTRVHDTWGIRKSAPQTRTEWRPHWRQSICPVCSSPAADRWRACPACMPRIAMRLDGWVYAQDSMKQTIRTLWSHRIESSRPWISNTPGPCPSWSKHGWAESDGRQSSDQSAWWWSWARAPSDWRRRLCWCLPFHMGLRWVRHTDRISRMCLGFSVNLGIFHTRKQNVLLLLLSDIVTEIN